MGVETKTPGEVKPTKLRQPFALAFSPRRMSAPDCTTRREPFTQGSERPASNGRSGNTKVPWHQRPLPADWSAEEQQFFSNWREELAALHGALVSAAADRPKLLRRARKRYMRLAYGLKEPIREAAIRAIEVANAVEAAR